MEKARSRRRRRRIAAVVAASLAFSAATPAYAAGGSATASDDQYGGVLGEQAGSGPRASGGTLPFTGLDLMVLVGAGTGLTAVGIGVRRLARNS